jgi:uncharacterized Zn-binding protein involved in type VI secretion
MIYNSYDGNIWNSKKCGGSSYYYVCFGDNGMFVAVGDKAQVIYSYDGIDWYPGTHSTSQDIAIQQVTYGNGIFISVGGASKRGVMMVSYDGINWETNSFYANYIRSVAYGKGYFAFVGEGKECWYAKTTKEIATEYYVYMAIDNFDVDTAVEKAMGDIDLSDYIQQDELNNYVSQAELNEKIYEYPEREDPDGNYVTDDSVNDEKLVSKKYVDDSIATIPVPDLSDELDNYLQKSEVIDPTNSNIKIGGTITAADGYVIAIGNNCTSSASPAIVIGNGVANASLNTIKIGDEYFRNVYLASIRMTSASTDKRILFYKRLSNNVDLPTATDDDYLTKAEVVSLINSMK